MPDRSKVIVCDTYDHTRERAQVHLPATRAETASGGGDSGVGANEEFTVVHPCMDTTVRRAAQHLTNVLHLLPCPLSA
jgi:hypothetical protein